MIDNQFTRSGTARPTEKVKRSQELAEYMVDKVHSMGEKCRFDILHNSGGEYTIHEFCGALGGVSIRYLDAKVHTQCLDYSLHNGVTSSRIFTQELRTNTENDKYQLRNPFTTHDKVVFLPGSNLLYININIDKLCEAVVDGAVIKPHPVTAAQDIKWLCDNFGKENVLSAKVKGAELIKHCKRAYMAKNTELWFLAIAFGCGVTDIGNNHGGDTYRQVLDVITRNHVFQPGAALNRIFGSCYSGIYFSKDEIDRNLENYIELARRFQ